MAERTRTSGFRIPQEGELGFRLFCPKPTIKILFYTDYWMIHLDPDDGTYVTEFGARILADLLAADDSDSAELQVTLYNRHGLTGTSYEPMGPYYPNTKLTPEVLAEFDEVWFFGYRQANTPAEPDNELTDPEVAALTEWMATGGVLMSGDHSNPRPNDADASLDDLLNMGRAIGKRVPRAGELRRWDGGPPMGGPDSYNTQVPTPQTPLAEIGSLEAQEDEWPQQLILKTYPAPSTGFGSPLSYERHVHRLFCGREAPITVLPDHMHEGHLLVPTAFPEAVWPSGPDGQPLPEVIARGTDKRTGEIYDLVIAYDGDGAGVGRIVAHSTWHHFFNVNLRGFPPGGPVLSQLAQYYANLAIWLSPRATRAQIACWQLWRLMQNPTVQMAYRNSRFELGRAAATVLRRSAGPCTIRDIFDLSLGPWTPEEVFRPSGELMLGAVLHGCFDALERAVGEDSQDDMGTMVARGIRAAYDDVIAELDTRLADAQQARERLDERLRRTGIVSTD